MAYAGKRRVQEKGVAASKAIPAAHIVSASTSTSALVNLLLDISLCDYIMWINHFKHRHLNSKRNNYVA